MEIKGEKLREEFYSFSKKCGWDWRQKSQGKQSRVVQILQKVTPVRSEGMEAERSVTLSLQEVVWTGNAAKNLEPSHTATPRR